LEDPDSAHKCGEGEEVMFRWAFATVFVATSAGFGLGALSHAAPQSDAEVSCNRTPQSAPVSPALLTSGLPCQVEADAPFNLGHLQDAFDRNSWLTFLALSLPPTGLPLAGEDPPAAWEGWKNISAVMVPPGQSPTPWSAVDPPPSICRGLSDNAQTPVLRMVGKTPDLLTAVDQPFLTGPLIDQSGNYVHYEILINRSMFDYIVSNKLYGKAGQKAFTGKVDFPSGSDKPAEIGAIMIKAAWKVLEDGDQPADFHATRALLYTAASDNPPIKETCRLARMGLVGLHIAHKTATEPQWVWSTFEHVANAPTQADIDKKTLLAKYNFYDPTCPAEKCPINLPPPRPWNPNFEPFADGFHSQIERVISLTAATMALNQKFQSILKGSVWANYQLVSTQWPTDAKSATDPTGEPAPQFLANTTMETYVQGSEPGVSSTCINCHNNATDKQGRFSDFTYILERAQ
jgi:hypothetical protein